MTEPNSEPRSVITFPPDAVLEAKDVAAALHVTEAMVGKMDLPCFYAGRKPRFIWGQVLEVLRERATPDARPRRMA